MQITVSEALMLAPWSGGNHQHRAEGRGGVSLRRRSSTHRSLLQRRNRRPVRLVGASLSALLLYVPGSSRYHRLLSSPFISHYFIQIRRRESCPVSLYFFKRSVRQLPRHVREHEKPHYWARRKTDLSIRKIVRHRIYIFVIDTTEIRDELSRSATLRCAKSKSIAIKICENMRK